MRIESGSAALFVVIPDGLLHGLGTVEGAAGDCEHGHEAITEVLDLSAAVGLDRATQEGKVRRSELVGRFWVQTRSELGGADQICEDE
jgi:hypothetical protein